MLQSRILWGAGKGAVLGGVGGLIFPISGPLVGMGANALGASKLVILGTEVVGSSVITGTIIGMLDAYMEGEDIWEGAISGAVLGLLLAPLGPLASKSAKYFSPVWNYATSKLSSFLTEFFHAGRGKPVGLGRKILRSFWEDRKTFNASREFFKRMRALFGFDNSKQNWSLEHMIIKQRWYRGTSPVANKMLRRILRGVGDSGINLVPVPQSFNQYLFNHPIMSGIFNYGFYAGAFAVEYTLIKCSYAFGSGFWEWIFSPEDEIAID